MKFAVIGAGSWGTTLANLLSNNGHDVMLWAREPEVVEGINKDHHNPYFVSHLEISKTLVCTNDMDEAIDKSELALISIPSGFIKATLEPHREHLKKLIDNANTINCINGPHV